MCSLIGGGRVCESPDLDERGVSFIGRCKIKHWSAVSEGNLVVLCRSMNVPGKQLEAPRTLRGIPQASGVGPCAGDDWPQLKKPTREGLSHRDQELASCPPTRASRYTNLRRCRHTLQQACHRNACIVVIYIHVRPNILGSLWMCDTSFGGMVSLRNIKTSQRVVPSPFCVGHHSLPEQCLLSTILLRSPHGSRHGHGSAGIIHIVIMLPARRASILACEAPASTTRASSEPQVVGQWLPNQVEPWQCHHYDKWQLQEPSYAQSAFTVETHRANGWCDRSALLKQRRAVRVCAKNTLRVTLRGEALSAMCV